MTFVEIRTNDGTRLAVNPTQISNIHRDETGIIVITMGTDRKIYTNQFRNIKEAVHYVRTSSFDTSGVGARQ